MRSTRRQFMGAALAGAAFCGLGMRPARAAVQYRLSACDWSIASTLNPAALELAKRLGLDGVEVSVGNAEDPALKIADPAFRQQYKDAVKATGVVVSSLAMGLLNNAPLATEPRGPQWLDESISAAADLKAKVILMAFFGKGDLLDKDGALKAKEVDAVVQRVKEAAPKAEKAGVILGLENTLSAKDNLLIMDKIQSSAVKMYYDVGNSTNGGYNVPQELRDMKDRICQVHFKDGSNALGEGAVALPPIVDALNEIQYKGWFVLETAVLNKDLEGSFKKNIATLRGLFKV